MPKRIAEKTALITAKGLAFDVKLFLDTAGAARRIDTFRKSQRIYSQGDPRRV